jgi:hypothetical protein
MQCRESRIKKNHKAPHHPPPLVMHIDQQRVGPAEPVVGPKPRVDDVCPGLAYICDAGVRQLAVPLVLYLGDLAALVEDVDFAADGRLLAEALDFVHGRHVHFDRVAGRGDAVGFALDGGEGGLQAVLL